MTTNQLETRRSIDRTENEDQTWFAQNPAREWRLRRAADHEYTGQPPAGTRVFTILHRSEVDRPFEHRHFIAPEETATLVPDDVIAEMARRMRTERA